MMKYGFFSHIWRSKLSFIVLQVSIMTISLIPLVLVQQATKSMIEEISKRIIETSSGHIILSVPSSSSNADMFARIQKNISRFPEVQRSEVEIDGGGILRKNTIRTAVTIRGVEESFLQEESFAQYAQVTEGAMSFTDARSIVLGSALAEKLSVHVGDTVLLLTTRSDVATSIPKISRFIVAGIFTVGYEELDKSWAFVPLSKALDVISPVDRLTSVKIKIHDPFALPNALVKRAKVVREKATMVFSRITNALSEYGTVLSWYQYDTDRYQLFVQTREILNIAMLVAVFLAAITLSSTMGMRIIDLETDIAVLKAIGADPKKLEWQLLLQGIWGGVVSAIVGIVLGIALHASSNVLISWIDATINTFRKLFGGNDPVHILNAEYYLQKIPFHIYWADLIVIMVFAIVLSTCAAYIPMRKMRSIPPIKIIRHH